MAAKNLSNLENLERIKSNITNSIKLLLIEDNEMYSEGLALLLRTSNIDVQVVNSGEAALEIVFEMKPDAIVLDIMLSPYLDGFTLLTKLKQDLRVSHIPVILISAMSFPDKIEQGLALGANDYLVKPFKSEELILKVNSLVSLSRNISNYSDRESIASHISTLDPDQKLANEFSALVSKIIADNVDITVPEIVASLSVGYARLESVVKKVYKTTPVAFILTKRLERADLMLRNSNMSINSIAYAAGFKSTSYFCTTYKKHFGNSPLANRNNKE